jgi:membrane fusion protein, multidrug efflux system
MQRRGLIGSSVLLVTLAGTGVGLALWKTASLRAEEAASANQPEPVESVAAAIAKPHEYHPTTTAVGTVLALRSVSLRNELPGTVRQVMLTPGQVVEEGTLLVAIDVSVEEAELKAYEAQAALAETLLTRARQMLESKSGSATEYDKAKAERDVARAQVSRVKAVIARKTIVAPFRARVGIADVHPGQYLEEGTLLTTLQGVDDAVHVDFTVAQRVAAALKEGDEVEVLSSSTKGAAGVKAKVIAVDAKVDPTTRNAAVRARLADAAKAPSPGASVRVKVPSGPALPAVAVPASALRKGPGGDYVFVIAPDKDGKDRATVRRVTSGDLAGDEVLIHAGLEPGERVAASGSFKLRDAVLVALADPVATAH